MGWNAFATELTVKLIPIIASGIAALIGVAVAYLIGAVKAKFGEQAAVESGRYLQMMQTAASDAVITLQQTVVDDLKQAKQFTPEAAAQVKKDAVNQAMATLGSLTTKIQAQLQIDVPSYMAGLIERSLKDLKAQTAPAPDPADQPKQG